MKHQTSGYILILTLMMVALSVVLITYITQKGSVFLPYARAMVDREKAVLLASGGIQLAISELSQQPEKPAEKPAAQEAAKKEMQGSQEQQFLLKMLLPIHAQWRTMQLQKKRDGVDGTLYIYVTAQEGKININNIYDIKTHKFLGEGNPQGDYKKLMQELFGRIEKIMHGKDLFVGFEKFLKDRQYRVNDVTELLTIKEFEIFKRNVVPQPSQLEKKGAKSEQTTLYLTDIFTTESPTAQLEPWLFSHSLAAVLEVKTPDKQEDKERFNEVIKKFKSPAQWPTDWKDSLEILYGKPFTALPQGIAPMLTTQFAPKLFAVLSFATVGSVTQKLYAVIERTSVTQDGATTIKCVIKKIYWL